MRFAFLNNIGAAVEYYDYVLFALCISYVQHSFFSANAHFANLFSALLAFQFGAWARLVAGYCFSVLIRKSSLALAMVLGPLVMGVATIAMACLPGYESLGILAPILLIVFRVVQGAAFALEVPNTLCFGAQHVPASSQGLFTGFAISSITLGSIVASLCMAIVAALISESAMAAFGWRLMFAIGGACGVGVYLMRRTFMQGLEEQQAQFRSSIEFGSLPSFVARTVIFLLPASMITNATCFPAIFSRLFGIPAKEGYAACLSGLVVAAICAPIFGFVLRRFGSSLSKICLMQLILCGILWSALWCSNLHWIYSFCMLYQVVVAGVVVISYSAVLPHLKGASAVLPYNLAFALSASALSYNFSTITVFQIAVLTSALMAITLIVISLFQLKQVDQ